MSGQSGGGGSFLLHVKHGEPSDFENSLLALQSEVAQKKPAWDFTHQAGLKLGGAACVLPNFNPPCRDQMRIHKTKEGKRRSA
jgi:hypothetical protein